MEMDSLNPTEIVENAQALASVFGEWPSFHDAEVLRLVLDRGPKGPWLEATLHVFQTTSDVDAKGVYVTRLHTLITIRFERIELHCIKWFNQQNAVKSQICCKFGSA